ncbi:MAG TPA: peroxidase family protein [Pyrinomonadaceae bacterium]|nr:peroxidase family protein [Pyrinomonadaceae bacterium]
MQRQAHGFNAPDPPSELSDAITAAPASVVFPVAESEPGTVPFSFMFPDLTDDDLLTPSETMLADLAELGASMQDTDDDTQFNSAIPAAYTYFAQFIDHDITFSDVKKEEGQTDSELLADPNLSPWSKKEIEEKVRNKRTTALQLECVYGNISPGQLPPRDGQKFVLGQVCPHHGRPADKDENNDLPRLGHSKNPKKDRAAFINDPRNDSNLIVSQIHVAFLRAHNAIVDQLECPFDDAKLILQKSYQWMVYNEFLPRFVRQEDIKAAHDKPLFDHLSGVPLEFSVGAFRFGHSLVRKIYYLNDNFSRVPLQRLFMLTVLSNGLTATLGEGCLCLPGNKIIEWRKFLGGEKGRNNARMIRPQLVEPLSTLLDEANKPVNGETRLAVQDLKRGYMLRIPTGQALADRMGVAKLTPDDLKAVAVNPRQLKALGSSEFLEKTPLWFYVLAEAAKQNADAEKENTEAAKQNIDKLGPVGGRIVAEAITGFIRRTPDSFLIKDWTPAKFGFKPNTFFIPDLLRLAGVLEKL